MQSNYDPEFEKLVSHILKSEGGYNDVKADKGGKTKYGISQKSYPNLDIKNLTIEQAKKIYHDNYYKPVKNLGIKDPRAAAAYFDLAVNSGVGKAQHFAKQFGDNYDALMKGRKNYYANIIARDPSQRIFEQGWNNRLKNLDRQVNALYPQPPKLSPNQQKELELREKENQKALEEKRKADEKLALEQQAKAQELPELHNVNDILTDWNFGRPKQKEQPVQPDPREVEKEFIKQQTELAKYQREIQQQDINRQKNLMLQQKQQHEQEKQEMLRQQHDLQIKQLFSQAGANIANLGKNPYADEDTQT